MLDMKRCEFIALVSGGGLLLATKASRAPERVHLAPSYCVVEEYVRTRLRKIRNKNGGTLPFSPRWSEN
jgi:hypothetical protein